ncbi:MAG: hypothetical protein HZA31_04225 [Opitutae bacterium]|nr:hypothetical protein [Opitutae bacterium]
MKTENLEALLLDRALGELRPEVAELLDEHLASRPELAAQAAALADTVQTARSAVAAPTPVNLPPLVVAPHRGELRSWPWRAQSWELTKLAACVALGLAVGWAVRSGRPAAQPASSAVATVAAPSSASGTSGLWSKAALLAEHRLRAEAAARPGSRYELRWEAPLKTPRVEEKL